MKVASIMQAQVTWACGHTYVHQFKRPMSKADIKVLKNHAAVNICEKCQSIPKDDIE